MLGHFDIPLNPPRTLIHQYAILLTDQNHTCNKHITTTKIYVEGSLQAL